MKFQQAAAYLDDWSNRSLMEHYYQGLKKEVKKKLIIYKNSKDLNILINIAIKIDNNLFKCWAEQYQANILWQISRQHTKNKGDAIELNSINQKNSQKDKFKQFDKKP